MADRRRSDADPPLREAWRQALAGIRVRFGRHVLTGVGICLGTAFFASTLTLRATESASSKTDPAALSRLDWLAGTSLLMCLVGITNSMLLSVAERFREIGTFKCIGASDTFIVKVFLMEAFVLGAIGSVAGALLGVALMGGALALMGFAVPFFLLPMKGLLAVGVGMLLTVGSAIGPAVQAARMPAVSALRTEV